ncbi:MAG: gamma-glutamyltransferase [Betaproteobacteria bacterium]|nr:gamma-glutamyltransferase [Betaproteobacteria bacterium]
MLGLVEPQSSGIGGGAFMLVHDARRSRLIAYDGRETAPAAATPDRFRKPDGAPMAFRDAVATGLAVGVPGAIRMLSSSRTAATVGSRSGIVPRRRSRSPTTASACRPGSRC